MKKLMFLAIAACLSVSMTLAASGESPKNKSLYGIELLTGFSAGKLIKGQGNYHLIPFLVDFDFDLKPFLQKFKFSGRNAVLFQLEPFMSFVSSPDDNIETGVSFMLKAGFLPDTSRFQPYVKAGVGMVYMTQHMREQSTQFNFAEQGGAGIQYFFSKNTSFILEGRFRHLSNAGIKTPNHGIGTYSILTGIAYRF